MTGALLKGSLPPGFEQTVEFGGDVGLVSQDGIDARKIGRGFRVACGPATGDDDTRTPAADGIGWICLKN